LNTQYIKKQKVSEADINISYGGFSVELSEQMYEIGEVCIHWFTGFMYTVAAVGFYDGMLSTELDESGRSEHDKLN